MKYYLNSNIGDFCQYTQYNAIRNIHKRKNSIFYIKSNEKFCSNLNNFDYILMSNDDNKITEYCINNGIKIITHKTDLHPYNFIAKYGTQDIGKYYIYPREKDYLEVKEELKDVDMPIVCITGRNLEKHEGNNDILEDVIKELSKKDVYIINTTIEPPDLKYDNYKEIGRVSASKEMAYFMNANCCINCEPLSGALAVYAFGKQNMLVLDNKNGVVLANHEIKGKSIISERIKLDTVKTKFIKRQMKFFKEYSIKEFNKELDDSIVWEKPKDVEFFNERKLIYL